MSKRNIAYIKPQDPKFLQQLKQEIGYKEGPSVDTKRQKLEDLQDDFNQEDRPELEDEKPQIVVLKSGDLTAEEVAAEEKRLAKEAAELPADLNQPIIFRKKHKVTSETIEIKGEKAETSKHKSIRSSKKLPIKNTIKLSFNTEEEEEDQ